MISGTPTQVQATTFVVQVADPGGRTSDATLSLQVDGTPGPYSPLPPVRACDTHSG